MANKRLIDANALKDDFRRYMADRYDRERCVSEENCITCGRVCLFQRTINNAPTVDAVEVVHGHWEDALEIKSFRHTNIPVVKCSKCECYFCDIINNHHWFYHYCPNCGAKMDLTDKISGSPDPVDPV